MLNKDMSQYRDGRKESNVVQTWLNQYKQTMMNKAIYRENNQESFSEKTRIAIFNGTASTAEIVADLVVDWLESPEGKEFVQEAFHIDIPKHINVRKVWRNEYRQMVMNDVIFRQSNRETVSSKVLDAVYNGTPETPEIVTDTIIGWLNSPVGRTFISDAFHVSVPKSANDGTEYIA